jgi:glycosyltransferase involved in cell wall biosynthesis
MINVNQKILWLADFDLDRSPGGAQRSDKIIIDQGKLLGFNILKTNYENFGKHINIHDYDVLVTSNVCAVLQEHPWVLNEITKHKYHIRIEHDSNDYLNQENRVKLFSFCKKTFFLTDYHFNFFQQLYGNIFKNVEIVPDPIETDKFYNYGQEREDKILYVGYMHLLKGTNDFFELALRNPDKKYVIAGWSDYQIYKFLSVNVPNIEYLDLIKYEQMPKIYNKYKFLYYEPNLREPFCRSAAEAVICGMRIITSKQSEIGCFHDIEKYGMEKFKNNCKKAAIDFWNKA